MPKFLFGCHSEEKRAEQLIANKTLPIPICAYFYYKYIMFLKILIAKEHIFHRLKVLHKSML